MDNVEQLQSFRLSSWFDFCRPNTFVGWFIALCFAVAAHLILAQPNLASDSQDATIARIEQKLFQHNYSKDTVENRLDRLEKMIFGESKSGTTSERINNLASAVPGIDSEAAAAGRANTPVQDKGKETPLGNNAGNNEDAAVTDSSQYPAVTAIENRLFGKSFASEPINKRLDRLETKVFGHASGIDDLSERMDRLKQHTGIDIAKQAPPGSDWADDEDMDTANPIADRSTRGFNRQDLRHEFGTPSPANSADLGETNNQMGTRQPRTFEQGAESGTSDVVPPPQTFDGQPYNQQMGLNQEVGALEQEIFGRMHPRDPLPARLNRLESAVFPQEKPAADKALPERVNRLLSAVPLSQHGTGDRTLSQHGLPKDTDMEDFAPLGNPQPRATGGLSKIMNSIGNLLTGSSYLGGYPMSGGAMVTDPQTGLWLNPRTGALIDPMTGAIVGQRMVTPGTSSGTVNGFGSFNNGFAPYSPYGSGFGTGYGTGMQFGIGNMGRYGFGMWP